MQNYNERYGGMLGCRTGKLLASLQKLAQTRTSLLVPRLLGGPDVCGPRTPSAPHDAVQTPRTYPLSSPDRQGQPGTDRKSTRLNSSHLGISYAVFCLK